MTGVEMIKDLKRKGFKVIKVEGSHYHMEKNGLVSSVPHHHRELGKGVYNKILKDLGLK
jgi:predicted RNA binding protein YcfA (HicA-like mRNA interferase family)